MIERSMGGYQRYVFCICHTEGCHEFSSKLIRELHDATQSSMDEDQSRGTQLLEIYALEIQMHNEMKNYKKLKVISAIIFGRLFYRYFTGDI